MAPDHIGRAMKAGKRWAAEQLNQKLEITPSSAEQAAQERFRHKGLQHLFIISALEILFEGESAAVLAVGGESKSVS
ncbi:hypothetical protein [Edaphobacter dinghuensis]|uniref:Uncharacterized protein n=1 Tax=Edaphobacter dinghuensis TaxID=1560005 RepID=A0A917HRF5_9BACT|nr:hypothetical protein [Edaphobacter dinghuensis]GGG86727.1 hypothetical protein GCM10011585_33370 [Edaphobacter dinghuensis]